MGLTLRTSLFQKYLSAGMAPHNICFCFLSDVNVKSGRNNRTAIIHSAVVSFCILAREALPTWDKQIQSLCFQVNNLLEKISQTAPEWTAQAMEAQMAQ